MRVSRPEEGTGAPKRPTPPPKLGARVDGREKSRLLAACPPSFRATKPDL